ncbi:MAG: PAS domain S-box protein [Chitinophagaceae bacterium]|nr:PAS domain S-box protein [Chitinophagaceae bacterium]
MEMVKDNAGEETVDIHSYTLPASLVESIPIGVIIRNPQGQLLTANKAALAITGLNSQQLADPVLVDQYWHISRENGIRLSAEEKNALLSGTLAYTQPGIFRMLNAEGGLIKLIRIHSYTAGPQPSTTIVTVENIAPVVAAEHLQSLIDGSKVGLFLLDTDYRLITMNNYARGLMSKIAADTTIDIPVSFIDMLPAYRREKARKALDLVVHGNKLSYDALYHQLDGSDIWFQIHYQPVVNKTDTTTTFICITATDITELKKKEAALNESEQRWKFALEGAGDGVWEYNFETKESYYSLTYKTMLGYSDEDFANDENEWKSRIHPEDLYKIGNIDQLYESGLIENHSVEYRIKAKDGEYKWILDRGKVIERNGDGKPLKVIGTHSNINQRKRAEERVHRSEQLFSSFMANTPTMNWIIDEKAVFRYLNEPYMRAFDLSGTDIGKSIYDIFPPDVCDGFVENNWKVWNSGKSIEAIEEGVGRDGQKQYYHIFKFPLKSDNGMRLLGGVALDITQKVEIETQLAEERERSRLEVIQAILNAQEKERDEIAYELHENVNQMLTSSKLMLEVAVEKKEQSLEFISRSLEYISEAISEIRKISHNLRPATLQDISLEAAIGEFVQEINQSGKLEVEYFYSFAGSRKHMSPEIQLAVLRMVQEQLNNIIKHPGASEARISLSIKESKLMLIISDNGIGFNVLLTKKGLGLNNITNRVEFYNGTIRINSAEGEGCVLEIDIPL